MRHRKKTKKLGRTASHRKALLSNLATELFEHKRIVTTLAKAKALRPFAERLITKAKKGYIRERDGLLPENHKVDLVARRYVARFIRRKAVVQELFESIAPVVVDRPGGYTRIVKLSRRRGDGARMAVIELVDWSAPQDGQIYLRRQTTVSEETEFEVVGAESEETAEVETEATREEGEAPQKESQQATASGEPGAEAAEAAVAESEATEESTQQAEVAEQPQASAPAEESATTEASPSGESDASEPSESDAKDKEG